ncbi:hypothetical protein MASSI9I_50567 [Massilia sp. 9I]|nr:hypothetical protein MASSI9I_50567 [Massilia sp. 9I]
MRKLWGPFPISITEGRTKRFSTGALVSVMANERQDRSILQVYRYYVREKSQKATRDACAFAGGARFIHGAFRPGLAHGRQPLPVAHNVCTARENCRHACLDRLF